MSALPSPVCPANRSSTARVYRCRHRERTALYRLMQQHPETWLAHRRERDADGAPIPRYVERELRGYLEGGVLACGFDRPLAPRVGRAKARYPSGRVMNTLLGSSA